MAVVGFAHPDAIISNAGARKGDKLVLTKPLGIGIITGAIKQGAASAPSVREAVKLMTTLNRDASLVMSDIGVDACTDVTGFGLLGHLWEMCTASKLGARVTLSEIPALDGARALAEQDMIPGGAYRNREFVAADVEFDPGIDEVAQLILCDPQTSGGLLIAVPSEKADALVLALIQAGVPAAAVIGEITEDRPGRIRVE